MVVDLEEIGDQLAALFTDDAVWEGGGALGRCEGRAAIRDRFREPTLWEQFHREVLVILAVLLIQSIPYAAAVFVSLVSALDLPGAWLGEAGATPAASEPEVEPEEGLALEKRAA